MVQFDMNDKIMIENKLNNIASVLKEAIYESEMAIGDSNKGYPYASGYARSALKMVLDDIKDLQSRINVDNEIDAMYAVSDAYIMENDYDDSMDV